MGSSSIVRSGRRPSRVAAAAFAACLTAAFASCARREAFFISDPAWEGLRPADSADTASGLRAAGFRVRKSVLPMADPHTELFAAVNGFTGRHVVLSPLLALEAEPLAKAFPGKLLILPGSPLRIDHPAVTAATADRAPALRAMGAAAAGYLAKELGELAADSGDGPAPVAFAYAVFLDSMPEESAAFREGFREGAASRGLTEASLVLESCPDDRTAAESLSRGVFSRDVRFIFIAAGQSSRFFLDAIPSRSCLAAGLGVAGLVASSPSLAASLEEDFKALARLAATASGKPPEAAAPSAPLRYRPLRKDLSRRIPYEGPR